MCREMLWMLFLDKNGGRYAYRGNEEVREINWRLKGKGTGVEGHVSKPSVDGRKQNGWKDERSAALE
jgi:hypothetical protein